MITGGDSVSRYYNFATSIIFNGRNLASRKSREFPAKRIIRNKMREVLTRCCEINLRRDRKRDPRGEKRERGPTRRRASVVALQVESGIRGKRHTPVTQRIENFPPGRPSLREPFSLPRSFFAARTIVRGYAHTVIN